MKRLFSAILRVRNALPADSVAETTQDFSMRKMHALAKRVAAKQVNFSSADFMGLELLERADLQKVAAAMSAEKIAFMRTHLESGGNDPLFLFFLMDCPQWNSPSGFVESVDWLFANHEKRQAAYADWKNQLCF